MLNPHESDILERLKHPEREAERRKVSRSLYLRNVLNSIFILLALVAMVGIGLNWGSIGIFGLDMVAALFGGSASFLSRLVYILVCLSAIWCITLFFRDDPAHEPTRGNA